MTDQENQWEQLKRFTIEALVSIAVFGIFAVASIIIWFIAAITGPIGILIKIVGWSVSVCGAICCIALIIRNTIHFLIFLFKQLLKSLFKHPPQNTVGHERRVK